MHSNKERLGCLWPHEEIDCALGSRGLQRDLAITRRNSAAGRLRPRSPAAAVAQLHCNNLRILQFAREGASLLTAARDDLQCLAKWIANSDNGAEITALYGVTLLGPICTRIGFTVRPRQLTMRNRMDTFFLKGLLLLYNRAGLGRKLPVDRRAVQVWMSREELLRRYNQTPGVHQREFPAPKFATGYRNAQGTVDSPGAASRKERAIDEAR
jgi:hypothetical protein